VGRWDVPAADHILKHAGTVTNLRVCRSTAKVVPVAPYPAADTVWAPADECVEAEKVRRAAKVTVRTGE
jgi:hypothetical protein